MFLYYDKRERKCNENTGQIYIQWKVRETAIQDNKN